MIVQVRLIQVRADDHLVAVAKQTPGKHHADGVGLLRRHLAWGKGLDEVIPHHAAQLAKPPLCYLHLGIGRFTAFAVKGRCKEMLFRFLWICGVSNTGIQRSLFSVGNITDAVIQPLTDGKNLRDCHYSFFTSFHITRCISTMDWISSLRT